MAALSARSRRTSPTLVSGTSRLALRAAAGNDGLHLLTSATRPSWLLRTILLVPSTARRHPSALENALRALPRREPGARSSPGCTGRQRGARHRPPAAPPSVVRDGAHRAVAPRPMPIPRAPSPARPRLRELPAQRGHWSGASSAGSYERSRPRSASRPGRPSSRLRRSSACMRPSGRATEECGAATTLRRRPPQPRRTRHPRAPASCYDSRPSGSIAVRLTTAPMGVCGATGGPARGIGGAGGGAAYRGGRGSAAAVGGLGSATLPVDARACVAAPWRRAGGVAAVEIRHSQARHRRTAARRRRQPVAGPALTSCNHPSSLVPDAATRAATARRDSARGHARGARPPATRSGQRPRAGVPPSRRSRRRRRPADHDTAAPSRAHIPPRRRPRSRARSTTTICVDDPQPISRRSNARPALLQRSERRGGARADAGVLRRSRSPRATSGLSCRPATASPPPPSSPTPTNILKPVQQVLGGVDALLQNLYSAPPR